MKFSIVVPVYKVEKYLPECLDSILAQTFPDFEVILVDDGSPDGCPQICDAYKEKDERIQVIHKPNGGLSSARNAGTEIATGEYIIYIDSDDYYATHDVLQQLDAKCDGITDIVLFGYQKYFDSKDQYGAVYANYPVIKDTDTIEAVMKKIVDNNMFTATAWTKAIRRALIVDNGIGFKEGLISEDIDWYFHVLKYAKTCKTINEPFLIYRQREGSISHAPKLNSLEDNIWILEKWPAEYKNAPLSDEMKNAMMKAFANYYANLLILCSHYDRKTRLDYLSRIKALKYLQKYSVSQRAKLLKIATAMFGIRGTVFLLSFVYRIVRKT